MTFNERINSGSEWAGSFALTLEHSWWTTLLLDFTHGREAYHSEFYYLVIDIGTVWTTACGTTILGCWHRVVFVF